MREGLGHISHAGRSANWELHTLHSIACAGLLTIFSLTLKPVVNLKYNFAHEFRRTQKCLLPGVSTH